jgi:ribose-phosphate pyrophosphokinase
MNEEMALFTGNANPALAAAIADHLRIPVGEALVSRFADGESRIHIRENVRGRDVFVVQPTCPPVNEHLMELLIMIDALKRASAARVTAVVPYYGYARQERKKMGREPITAKLVANLLTVAGADRLLTMDLHAPAIAGFFDIPVDNLTATPILVNYLAHSQPGSLVVVAPDAGGVHRAMDFAQRIGASLAFITKERLEPGRSEVLGMVGHVTGCVAVIIDDIVASGSTLLEALEVLTGRGATQVLVCATHPVFAPGCSERLRTSALDRVIVTDTIPVPPEKRWPKLEVVSVAPMFAEAIRCIHENRSVSALFV